MEGDGSSPGLSMRFKQTLLTLTLPGRASPFPWGLRVKSSNGDGRKPTHLFDRRGSDIERTLRLDGSCSLLRAAVKGTGRGSNIERTLPQASHPVR